MSPRLLEKLNSLNICNNIVESKVIQLLHDGFTTSCNKLVIESLYNLGNSDPDNLLVNISLLCNLTGHSYYRINNFGRNITDSDIGAAAYRLYDRLSRDPDPEIFADML